MTPNKLEKTQQKQRCLQRRTATPLRKSFARKEREVTTSDLLMGYAEIGEFLHMSARQVEHLCTREDGPPTFKIGRKVCARSRSLSAWLDKQEGRTDD